MFSSAAAAAAPALSFSLCISLSLALPLSKLSNWPLVVVAVVNVVIVALLFVR